MSSMLSTRVAMVAPKTVADLVLLEDALGPATHDPATGDEADKSDHREPDAGPTRKGPGLGEGHGHPVCDVVELDPGEDDREREHRDVQAAGCADEVDDQFPGAVDQQGSAGCEDQY